MNDLLLEKYEELKDFQSFLEGIKENEDNFDYIVALDPRFFNLVCKYIPNLKKFTSLNGLIMQIDRIAEFYIENNNFTKILFIDDIITKAVPYKDITNFILEGVYTRINQIKPVKDFKNVFEMRNNFFNSIKYVCYRFSRSIRGGSGSIYEHSDFLSSYLPILDGKVDYAGNLRVLKYQIEEIFKTRNVLNTTFFPSIHSKQLMDYLLKKETKMESKVEDWVLVPWTYNSEDMIMCCRLTSEKYISTIRVFPNRNKENEPWITSHTMLGKMDSDTLNNLCNTICNEFNWDITTPLGKILQEDSDMVKVRAELVSFVISMIDLIDFTQCDEIKALNIDLNNNDLQKISQYFGINDEISVIHKQLETIIHNPQIALNLKKKIEYLVNNNASNILPTDLYQNAKYLNEKISSKECSKITENVLKIFFRIALNKEFEMNNLLTKENKFFPEDIGYAANRYNETYTDEFLKSSLCGNAGVITNDCFFDLLMLLSGNKETAKLAEQIYQYLAAYCMLCDAGIIENSVQYLSNFVPLIKTNEATTVYYPLRMRPFLICLTNCEDRYFYFASSRKNALLKAYEFMREIILEYPDEIAKRLDFDDSEKIKWNHFLENLPTIEDFITYTDWIYDAGKEYADWDFSKYNEDVFYMKVYGCILEITNAYIFENTGKNWINVEEVLGDYSIFDEAFVKTLRKNLKNN